MAVKFENSCPLGHFLFKLNLGVCDGLAGDGFRQFYSS